MFVSNLCFPVVKMVTVVMARFTISIGREYICKCIITGRTTGKEVPFLTSMATKGK